MPAMQLIKVMIQACLLLCLSTFLLSTDFNHVGSEDTNCCRIKPFMGFMMMTDKQELTGR